MRPPPTTPPDGGSTQDLLPDATQRAMAHLSTCRAGSFSQAPACKSTRAFHSSPRAMLSQLVLLVTTLSFASAQGIGPCPAIASPGGGCGAGVACCPTGQCCSQFGFCGVTPDHCGPNCQAQWSTCGVQSTTGTCAATAGPGGACGANVACCSGGQCCSQFGFCGVTPDHCGPNCQALYGSCGLPSPAPPSPPPPSPPPLQSPTPNSPPPVPPKDTTHNITCNGTASSGGLCGSYGNHQCCQAGECCSQWGYCGITPGHCGANCQKTYGECGGQAPPPPPPVNVTIHCLLWHNVTVNETCTKIWTFAGITQQQFTIINPKVNCSALPANKLVCIADNSTAPPKAKITCLTTKNLTLSTTCGQAATQFKITLETLQLYNPGVDCSVSSTALPTGTSLCVNATVLLPQDDPTSPLNPKRIEVLQTAADILAGVDPELPGLIKQFATTPSQQLSNQVGARLIKVLARPDGIASAEKIEAALGPDLVIKAVVPGGSLSEFCSGITSDPTSAALPGVSCMCGPTPRTLPLIYCSALLFQALNNINPFTAKSSTSTGATGTTGRRKAREQGGQGVAEPDLGQSLARRLATGMEITSVTPQGATMRQRRSANVSGSSMAVSRMMQGGVGLVSDGAAEMAGEYFSMFDQALSSDIMKSLMTNCDFGDYNTGKAKSKLTEAANSPSVRTSAQLGAEGSIQAIGSILADTITCKMDIACWDIYEILKICFDGGIKIPNLAMAPFNTKNPQSSGPGGFRQQDQSILLCGGQNCLDINTPGDLLTLVLKALVQTRFFIRLKLCIEDNWAKGFGWPIKDLLAGLCVTLAEVDWYFAKGQVVLFTSFPAKAAGIGAEVKVSVTVQAYHPSVVCNNPGLRCEDYCVRNPGTFFGLLELNAQAAMLWSHTWSWKIPDKPDPACPPPPPPKVDLWAAVRRALLKTDASRFLVSQQPDLTWAPSLNYKWADAIAAIDIMVNTKFGLLSFSLGDENADTVNYALASIAAFLGQSMQETIQYDACDENNYTKFFYAASNACGQNGQAYQEYKCSAFDPLEIYLKLLGQPSAACEVDPNMEILGTTQATWYGAPPPFFCGPRSKFPKGTPHWNYLDNICPDRGPNPLPIPVPTPDDYFAYIQDAANRNCSDYSFQKAGYWSYEGCDANGCPNDPAPAFGIGPRTDVEGCCWWGRGVIQTTGPCNFGKLNYYLGARAAREGRDAKFPTIDFCKNPEAICTADPQLKWVAGLYYFLSEVQTWNKPDWSYNDQLKAFVDKGMLATDTAFIDGVSAIVNRGCTSITGCSTGDVLAVDNRRANFRAVLQAMNIVPQGSTGGSSGGRR